jgi:hypothetical protein
MFCVDIIINFFSAFYDQDFQIVDDVHMISTHYLVTWFAVDLISVVPFDLMF